MGDWYNCRRRKCPKDNDSNDNYFHNFDNLNQTSENNGHHHKLLQNGSKNEYQCDVSHSSDIEWQSSSNDKY